MENVSWQEKFTERVNFSEYYQELTKYDLDSSRNSQLRK